MRRKTLARSLNGWLDRETIASLDIDPGARPEQLPPEMLGRLADRYAELQKTESTQP